MVGGAGHALRRCKLRDPNQGPPERLAAGRLRGLTATAVWSSPGPVRAVWPAGPHQSLGLELVEIRRLLHQPTSLRPNQAAVTPCGPPKRADKAGCTGRRGRCSKWSGRTSMVASPWAARLDRTRLVALE